MRYIPFELYERRKKMTVIRADIVRSFTIADIEKFLAKIYVNSSGCWLTKTKTVKRNASYKGYLVHRVSWELFRGRIPDNFTIDHLCMNPRCVNPEHLEPVTREENARRYNAMVKAR